MSLFMRASLMISRRLPLTVMRNSWQAFLSSYSVREWCSLKKTLSMISVLILVLTTRTEIRSLLHELKYLR